MAEQTLEEKLAAAQASIEKLEAAVHKANEEAATARHENKDLKAKLDDAESESGYRTRFLTARAELALRDLGVKNPERLVKRLDLDSIEESEDGSLVGFDEQVEELKTDFPEIFDPKKRAGDIDASDKGDAKVEKTPSEAQALRLLGKPA